jgi:hypothetical protein
MLAIALAVTAWIVPVQASQAVHLDQDRIVNADPANFTPNVLDGSVESIQQVGNTILIGGDFHQLQASTGGRSWPGTTWPRSTRPPAPSAPRSCRTRTVR